MSGYIVVSESGHFPIHLNAGGGAAFYRGLGRNPWGQVDDRLYAGQLSTELSFLRKKAISNGEGTFSPGVAQAMEDAIFLARACSSSDQDVEIIKVTFLGILNADRELDPAESNFLGLDCYVDGYGSLIELGLVSNARLFEHFNVQVNENGLFETTEALAAYVEAYGQVSSAANLEPIESGAAAGVYSIANAE